MDPERPPDLDAEYRVIHGPWPRWVLQLSLLKLALWKVDRQLKEWPLVAFLAVFLRYCQFPLNLQRLRLVQLLVLHTFQSKLPLALLAEIDAQWVLALI